MQGLFSLDYAPRHCCLRSFAQRSVVNLQFLRDLFTWPSASRTIILLEPDAMAAPRQYEVRPQNIALMGVGVASALALLFILILFLTPLRRVVVGPDINEYRTLAELNARRAAAFEDSVALQYRQISQLRALITGDLDSLTTTVPVSNDPTLPEPAEAEAVLGVTLDEAPSSSDWADHQQPALPLRWLDASDDTVPAVGSTAEAYLASLRLPALPPITGFVSRGFNAREGHFGVDIVVEEGSPVRAFGEGYVVFADWTHEGGYVIAVQHADAYLSVYKHNARLLKRVGDRVRSRETVALSGNTGEITSGPHLHFELWRNGLAQDPRTFFVNS
ncbi:MAG: M23 family metallopeptidase [Rhodothermaceae bacterium]|nr:M23 family metallopeptidase [Rhodothermaceae bacterium]